MVVLGGGLANGPLGQTIARAAQAAAHEAGRPIAVAPAAHPSLLPLIGVARRPSTADAQPGSGTRSASYSQTDGALAVLDFGSTGVKSAVALLGPNGALSALYPRSVVELGHLADGDHTAELVAAMVDQIAALSRSVADVAPGARRLPHVACSIATYLEHGQPIRQLRGAYTQLHTVSGALHVTSWFAAQLGDRAGTPIRVSFTHDGTAAAAAFAGQKPAWTTAVVMLGTALGVGFVPDPTGHRPRSPTFTIHAPTSTG
jgi:hypothetical protein